ncbi:unnamed protein product [Oppiella nova]|uniref:Uncharacterized protein n=1 Tax=Oppiella nova TaxID=334625 RepID=A0A7R9LYQ5_9ACAR|nr:unnamed protein product [Oppiella nova]CAG2167594.1 unnamed protein product [Oppiella nova]
MNAKPNEVPDERCGGGFGYGYPWFGFQASPNPFIRLNGFNAFDLLLDNPVFNNPVLDNQVLNRQGLNKQVLDRQFDLNISAASVNTLPIGKPEAKCGGFGYGYYPGYYPYYYPYYQPPAPTPITWPITIIGGNNTAPINGTTSTNGTATVPNPAVGL